MKTIPTKINKYNVYNAGNRLLGMGDEVPLPSFEASSETVSGAGVLGEFENGDIEFRPMRVVVRGRMVGFDPGKVKAGNGMETSVKLTILYILIELEDKPMVELDKINEVFKIRGVDVLAKIKEMC